MKKLALTSFILVFFIGISMANSAELFNVDFQSIDQEFSELNALENYVIQNDGVTYSQLKMENNNVIQTINFPLDITNITEGGTPTFPFCWGCALGPVGWVAVLILSNRQKTPSMKAFKGCILGSFGYLFLTVGGHEIWGWWPGLYTFFK